MENEKKLIDAINLELEEDYCPSDNTETIVAEIISHLRNSALTPTFSLSLSEYRARFRMNAECNASRDYYQQILAAEKRTEGIYFLEDAWGKEIKIWLDANVSEIPVVAALEDIYHLAPKTKSTKKWSATLDEVFGMFSESRVLTVIRRLLSMLAESEAVKKSGICTYNETKLKAIVSILALKHHEDDAELFKQLVLTCYTKVPCQGPISTSAGNASLQALSELDGKQGLVYLSELARQLKYPASAAKFAKKRLEDAAKKKGANVQDLESRFVPDYGLTD
ncbi:hypothetical protein Q4519_02910 [Motilimonas sp. 1_MG-2023]|uniref:hypothetical protein n=1 Tax=Motilimonas sp. 1_MG-2023 TaxID=3062672 RepID=UPI0026E37CD6|nr:hypothetical protein [Motilimonas sp. 1_MG-2023]MDO6524625.1 hypothetical protein [Motilimonas sp. 1_MG-2023]